VDSFRVVEKFGTGAPSGFVDAAFVARLWSALERAGKATTVRQQLLDATAVRR
jgi:hypothetical protein